MWASNTVAFDLQASLLGEWRETSGKDTIKVLDGGAVLLNVQGVSVKGQYTFIDNDRIRFESLFGTKVYSVELLDETLRLIDDKNKTRTYERWMHISSPPAGSSNPCSPSDHP